MWAQRKLRSADSFCWFSHEAAHFFMCQSYGDFYGMDWINRTICFSDLDAIQSLCMDSRPKSEGTQVVRRQGSATDVCPTCRLPYDKGKKRKLIDSCGHERCWTCMFNQEECPLCSNSMSFRFHYIHFISEPRHEKNVSLGVSDQVRLKLVCSATEAS